MAPEIYRLSQRQFGIEVIITHGEDTLGCNMPKCNHIEADYRIVLYVIKAIDRGSCSIVVRTGDTDVLVILVGHSKTFLDMCENLSLTVMFTAGSRTQYFDILKIAKYINLEYCKGFMLFYAYTGCDYTPHFYNIGKTKWFDLYIKDDAIKKTFTTVCENPLSYDVDVLYNLLNFTLKGYGFTDGTITLLRGRYEVLMRKSTKNFRQLPPSPGAAVVQARKAIFVAAYQWGKADSPTITYDHLDQFGWKKTDQGWAHTWTTTTFPEEDIYRLAYRTCGCTLSDCSGGCHCGKHGIECVSTCACKGKCKEIREARAMVAVSSGSASSRGSVRARGRGTTSRRGRTGARGKTI